MTNLSKTDYFPSLDQMGEAHVKLLEQRLTKEDELSDLVYEIESFINRGRETGILLGSDDERRAAQSLLDYWSIALNRSGHQAPDFILAKYNLDEAPELDEKDCPYPGLKVFEQADRDLFFGRTQLIQQCLKKLESQQLLVVIGPPNSGKSSLVLAGLLPELEGRKNWKCLSPKTPASYSPDKLKNVVEVIEKMKVGQDKTPTIVLVIDQFDDLFTLYSDNEIRQEFADNLEKLVKSTNKIKIILTMRQDFQTDCENLSPRFSELFKNKKYLEVTPFTSNELKEAIEIPAKRKGLQFEGYIVEKLVRDLEGEQMPLPLLQFVLMKLWEKREKNLITEKIYREVMGIGIAKLPKQSGVRWALSHTADDFYQHSSPKEQETVKRIFLQLFEHNLLEVKSNTLERLQRKSLYQESEDKEQTDRVINELSKANLLRLTKGKTEDDEQIEVVHPSLRDSWHLLKSLLEEKRAKMDKDLALLTDAKQWDSQGRNSDWLLRGKQIDQARQLIKYSEASQFNYVETFKNPRFLELQKDFVQKSLKRRRNNRIKSTFGSVIILGLIIGLPISVYYADLQKQHEFVIRELQESLENTKAELQKANEHRKNAEDTLERNKQSLQEIEAIKKNAEQLLNTAEKTQRNVEKQQEIAKQILNEAESARRDAQGNSQNFWWGTLIGVIMTFVVRFLYDAYTQILHLIKQK